MNEYQLKNTMGVMRLSDKANIPNDPNNRDWAEYQVWLASGNTPDEISEVRIIPAVTKRQMLIWLYKALSITDKDIQEAIQTIKDPTKSAIALITWLNPDELFNRYDPIIIELAPIFGLKPEQVDEAFIEASKL